MNCSKYILSNTGNTIAIFNYQRCADALYQNQVELYPNETKNIWLMDDTYSTAFINRIQLTNLGPFPSTTSTPDVTPSPTPTPSITPTYNPTPTPTITLTPTNTSTPTPTPYRNIQISNLSSAQINSVSGDFATSWNFSFPLTTGMNGIGFHGAITNGDQISIDIGGSTGDTFQLFIYKNGIVTLDEFGVAPYTVTYTFPTNLTLEDSLGIDVFSGAEIWSAGYDPSSQVTACSNSISSPSIYYVTTSFNIIFYLNANLSTPAPDGYYGFDGYWYQVTGGSGLVTQSGNC